MRNMARVMVRVRGRFQEALKRRNLSSAVVS